MLPLTPPCHSVAHMADALRSDTSYVLFVRRDDTVRKALQRTVALAAGLYCGYRLFKLNV